LTTRKILTPPPHSSHWGQMSKMPAHSLEPPLQIHYKQYFSFFTHPMIWPPNLSFQFCIEGTLPHSQPLVPSYFLSNLLPHPPTLSEATLVPPYCPSLSLRRESKIGSGRSPVILFFFEVKSSLFFFLSPPFPPSLQFIG